MTTIQQLSTISSLSAGDLLVVWSAANSDSRKASLSALMAFIESQFASPEFETVITAPTASGFNIQMPAYTKNVWEIINPTGTFAAGTLTLPAPADCFDGQQVIVCTTQVITAFTLAGNGSTIVGAPTSLSAGGFFTIRFNALQKVWYCTSQNIVFTAAEQAFLTTPSSANLRAVMTDESGTGALLFADGNIGDAHGKSLVLDDVLTTKVKAVASLPNAVTTLPGTRATVNDSNATLTAGIGAVVAGGGGNIVPVFCNGSDWRIG